MGQGNSMSGFQGIHLKVDKTLENMRNSRLSVDLTANKNSIKQFYAQNPSLDDIKEVDFPQDPVRSGILKAKELLKR